ncbi:hypothetical protein IG631_06112 [Alternaria alternata]|nr:hypothetical protein IG631_06112 [Alternaria alternata]
MEGRNRVSSGPIGCAEVLVLSTHQDTMVGIAKGGSNLFATKPSRSRALWRSGRGSTVCRFPIREPLCNSRVLIDQSGRR